MRVGELSRFGSFLWLRQASTRNSNARLFADDCLLYRHIASSNDSTLLQQDTTALERWEETWQMTFNPAKCSVIRISTNRRHIINTSYQLHGHTLEVVDSSKYIGVTTSEDLTWRKHIEDTATKANKTLGFLRRNLSECTSKVKSVAYTTMICPRLELGLSSDKRCPNTGTSSATSS